MRVLVIEDDDSVRAAVRRALLLGGCEVIQAQTGEQGLLAAQTDVPDAIVDERDLPHVFDRFYRAAHARRLPGSGLGLAIVMQTAHEHGGNATAQNAPCGGGLVQVSFGPPLQRPDARARQRTAV